MGIFDGVLLLSDFDNTLVYTNDAFAKGLPIPPLSPRNREAIEGFISQGGRFGIATGRALSAVAPFAPDIPMNVAGVVCNGAAVYDFANQCYLDTAPLDRELLELSQEMIADFPGVAIEACALDDTIYVVQRNAVTDHHIRITGISIEERESLLSIDKGVGKLIFEGTFEDLEALRVRLGDNRPFELVYSNPHLLEMTAKGANKGAMATALCQRYGIAPDHFYCVGDEANDLSMLGIAAQGFAPSNAIERVKASGVVMVCHATDGAIAEVIAYLEKKYSAT